MGKVDEILRLILEEVRYSQKSIDILIDRASKLFSVDYGELSGRGYVLPDGGILQFGSDDHRSIVRAYYDDEDYISDGRGDIEYNKLSAGSSSGPMIDFMDRVGAVRFAVTGGDLIMSSVKKPTRSQRRTLTSREYGEVIWTELNTDYSTRREHRFDNYEFLDAMD